MAGGVGEGVDDGGLSWYVLGLVGSVGGGGVVGSAWVGGVVEMKKNVNLMKAGPDPGFSVGGHGPILGGFWPPM